MKERQILFSGAMVRALLDGSKTQTRRMCKPAEAACLSFVIGIQDPRDFGQRPLEVPGSGWFGDEEGDVQFSCPYGRPGDRLWVRETWRSIPALCLNDGKSSTRIEYAAGRKVLPLGREPAVWDVPERGSQNWKPSNHMPRWASRITLEVTGVRVERLQSCSEVDARAEGVTIEDRHTVGYCAGEFYPPSIRAYRELWEQINGAGSWEANPWVWVIEFHRID